jgi:hypothetical protein
MAFRGSVPRRVISTFAASILLLSFGGLANATAHQVTVTASVHISVRYDAARFTWHGSFREVRPDGAVVARGRAIDRLRQTNGADWLITRRLTTRAGTLQFRISGPLQRPTARLHWLIVAGTGAYAALQGHGIDVERARDATATAVMRGVPALSSR